VACSGCGYVGKAERQFDDRRAARDMARYREKGANPTTRLLRDALAAQGPLEGSLLDVGSGIAALTFELLNLGIGRATAVDASHAFLAAAADEAARRDRARAVEFIHGDFLDVAAQLPAATIVAMDRVVCCYPSYDPMLRAALQHAERFLALSYPKDAWYIRAVLGLENIVRKWKGNPFRAYVHPVAEMQRIIDAAGFRLTAQHRTWMWCASLYARA